MDKEKLREISNAVDELQRLYELPISERVVHNHAHSGLKKFEAQTVIALRCIQKLLNAAFGEEANLLESESRDIPLQHARRMNAKANQHDDPRCTVPDNIP